MNKLWIKLKGVERVEQCENELSESGDDYMLCLFIQGFCILGSGSMGIFRILNEPDEVHPDVMEASYRLWGSTCT